MSVQLLLVENLAAISGIEDLLCDIRARSIYLVIRPRENNDHFPLVLNHFCIRDA